MNDENHESEIIKEHKKAQKEKELERYKVVIAIRLVH